MLKRKRNIIFTLLMLMLFFNINISMANPIDMPTQVQIEKQTDLSAALFRYILGNSWVTIAGDKGARIDGFQNPLGTLIVDSLAVLNIASLTYLSLLVIYMWGIFGLGSAHAGKIGGKQSSLWVPARHAIAFSFTAPVLNGLSLLQIVVIGAISLSINFANVVWDQASGIISKTMQSTIGPTVSHNTLTSEAYNLLPIMFESSTAQLIDQHSSWGATLNDLDDYWANPPKVDKNDGVYTAKNDQTIESSTNYVTRIEGGDKLVLYARSPKGMDKGILGSVSYDYPRKGYLDNSGSNDAQVDLKRKIAEARIAAAKELWDGVHVIAKKYLADSGESLNSSRESMCSGQFVKKQRTLPNGKVEEYWECATQSIDAPDYQTLINNYADSVQNSIQDAVQTYTSNNPELQKKIEKSLDYTEGTGSKIGWLGAGIFSFSISALQTELDQAVLGHINYNRVDSKQLEKSLSTTNLDGTSSGNARWIADHQTAYKNSASYFSSKVLDSYSYAAETQTDKDSSTLGKMFQSILGKLTMDSNGNANTADVGLLGSVLNRLQNSDPMMVLVSYGNRMRESSFWLFGVSGLTQLLGAFSGKLAPLGSSISNVVMIVGIVLFTCYVSLSFMLPLTPFLIWIRAVLGWIFLILEALLACPFMGVVIALPKGEGFFGDAGRKGIFLIIDIVIRPVLLVISAIFAIGLVRVCGWLYYTLFNLWFVSASSFMKVDITFNILGSIVVCYSMYWLIHTIYKLPSILPEKIAKWMGDSAGSGLGSESEMHEKANQVVGAAISHGTTAVRGIGQGGGGGHQPKEKELGEQKKLGGGGGGGNEMGEGIAPKSGGGGGAGGGLVGIAAKKLDEKAKAPGQAASTAAGAAASGANELGNGIASKASLDDTGGSGGSGGGSSGGSGSGSTGGSWGSSSPRDKGQVNGENGLSDIKS